MLGDIYSLVRADADYTMTQAAEDWKGTSSGAQGCGGGTGSVKFIRGATHLVRFCCQPVK